jgi:hypothetical protein
MSQEKKAVPEAFPIHFRTQSLNSGPFCLSRCARLEERVFGHKTFVLALVLAVLLLFSMQALLLRRSPVPSASAVVTGANIGIYWDRGCTQEVSSINWGTLEIGGTQQVVVYVRNEGNDTFNLALATQDWQPGNASQWLSFAWSCRNTTIAAGHVVKVTQTLSVPSDLPSGFSSFSFNIVFQGNSAAITGSWLPGDINHDGVVDLHDLAILAAAYGSKPGDPNWNPAADLNHDGVVNLLDLQILVSEYGQTDG